MCFFEFFAAGYAFFKFVSCKDLLFLGGSFLEGRNLGIFSEDVRSFFETAGVFC